MSEQLLEQLIHAVSGIGNQLQQVIQRLDRLDLRMDKLEQRMDRLDVRMDKLEQRMDGLEQRIDKLEKRMGGLEQRIDKLEQRMESNDQQVTQLISIVAEVLNNQSEMKVEMEAKFQRLDRIPSMTIPVIEGGLGNIRIIDYSFFSTGNTNKQWVPRS